MLKSFSIGIGIFLLVLGLSLHTIDSYTVRPSIAAQATGQASGGQLAHAASEHADGPALLRAGRRGDG